RVFLGWVNLQQMTRIAANHAAEHASAWGTPGDPAEKAEYQAKVRNDARLINCRLPNPLPDPVLSGGTALGAPVTVGLSCEFDIITPVISNVIGGTILVSAETTYPVKEGVVATVPGGGAPIIPAPEAKFTGSPQSGWGPSLQVTFTNDSTGAPSSQTWRFANIEGGTGTGSVNPTISQTTGPQTVTYGCTGTPGQTCTFQVSLTVGNAGGTDTETKPADYITLTVPPEPPAPIAEFSGTPRTGVEPQTVNFSFVDLRGGTVTYTRYEWDFNGDGAPDATGPNVSRAYPTDGVYDVSLTVTDSTNATNTLTKKAYIVISNKICTVPAFGNSNPNRAQRTWADAGFTTQVQFQPGNYKKINYQSLTGGTINRQPGGCDAVITVGP
ncbi:MAG: PKD domain-containing protein, partial [Acidobacteria bacterium]|nr:PKD domain-containing protein [Acidobacteriota bacterium]